MDAIRRLRAGYFAPALRYGPMSSENAIKLADLRSEAIRLADEIERKWRCYPVERAMGVYCSRCGTKWTEFQPKFCHECGSKIAW